jgi:peptidoglycan hydrolase-like protein with peptidoglycan-binding domain
MIERVQNSLKYNRYQQIPQLQIEQESLRDQNPLEIDRGMISTETASAPYEGERLIYLKTPYMRGPDVSRVQEALSQKGYSLTPDGVYGPKTETYVKDFQQKNGMHVDGVVGPALKKKLFS